MKRLVLLMFPVLLLFGTSLYGQEKTISGNVSDATESLPGVNILIKGTSTGTVTDFDGNYSLKVNEGDVLVVSYLGYATQEITVGAQDVIDISLLEDTQQLEEIVVIGYGTEKKSDATGALESIEASKINKGATTSPEMLLNGRVAGVQISPNSGQPGAEQNVRIRGVNSISASSEPLYVIDGVPIDNNRSEIAVGNDAAVNSSKLNPLSMIAPNDIESITVLKDASATAIYGSRGANGVIIIKTKSGVAGFSSVSYDSYLSLGSVSNKIDLLSADDYRSFVNSGNGNASTDWQDEIFRSAITTNHSLSFTGGGNNTQYRGSIGYLNQEGVVIGTNLETINGRLNVNQSFFEDRLKVQYNISSTRYSTDNIIEQQTGGVSGGIINNALKADPTQPVLNADGSFNEWASQVFNPVALANQVDDMTEGNRLIGSISAEYNVLEDLSIKVNLANDVDNQKRRIFQSLASAIGGPISGRAIREEAQYSNQLLETYLNYSLKFKENSLSVLGGYSWQEFDTDVTNVIATGFDSDNLGFNNINAQNQNAFALKESNRLISFFGRLNLNLGYKYLITATLRGDGSSKFGPENRWGVFPSAAFAWKIVNEGFMANQDFFTNLKLRLGYGVTGNQNIGNFRYLSTVNVNQVGGAVFGNQYVLPYSYTSIPNPNLQWEETSQFNIGLDFGIIKDKITGSIDFYNKVTDNLLLEVPAPQPSVSGVYLDNIGEMTNTGVELNLNYSALRSKEWNWDLNFNLAYNQNEIKELFNGNDITTGVISGAGAAGQSQIIRVGESIGSFYGFEFENIDGNGAEVFRDINNDDIIDDNDRVILGKALPDVVWGLNSRLAHKGFDFGILIRGQNGLSVFNNTRAEITQPSRLPGQNTNLEGAQGRQNDAYLYTSSRWIEDASFIKLDNITLGYTFNTEKLGFLKNARLYVTAQNLIIITDYLGYDPEVNINAGTSTALSYGVDYTAYPQIRSVLFGLNVSF